MNDREEEARKFAEQLLNVLNDDQIAAAYHRAYDVLDLLEEEMKMTERYLNAKAILAEIDKKATQMLQERGCTSIVTPHGTIHTIGKTTARITDPEQFLDFALRSNRLRDYLDLKANMTSCRSYSEKTRQPVPGVELVTYRRVSVTSPKAKRPHNDE